MELTIRCDMNIKKRNPFHSAHQVVLALCTVVSIPCVLRLAKGDTKWVAENWLSWAVVVISIMTAYMLFLIILCALRLWDRVKGHWREKSLQSNRTTPPKVSE